VVRIEIERSLLLLYNVRITNGTGLVLGFWDHGCSYRRLFHCICLSDGRKRALVKHSQEEANRTSLMNL
jgi:hypothetical protein